MIFAVISDIHGNLEALLSVYEYIKSCRENIDKIICLGDIVGYGADPGECIKLTRDISDVIIEAVIDEKLGGLVHIIADPRVSIVRNPFQLVSPLRFLFILNG